jgi:4'-phosphopantetheinyl transferase
MNVVTMQAIDVVPIDLHALEASVACARSLLSPSELERAASFRSDELRDAFVVRRAALRVVLGRVLDLAPATLAFRTGVHGKPEIVSDALRFNASASQRLAVIAIARDCDVGIDVEFVRAMPEALDVARNVIGVAEYAQLARLSGAERDRTFAVLWTRREAYVKGRGTGLRAALDDRPDAQWRIRDLSIDPQFACALAFRGPERALHIAPVADANDVIAAA